MKKYVSGLVLGIILACSLNIFAESELLVNANPFPVLVNGIQKIVEAYNINGSTYVKLSDVAKATDNKVNVKFNNENKAIEINTMESISTGGEKVSDENTRKELIINDEALKPKLVDGFSVYAVNGLDYIAAETRNNIVGFESEYFENNAKFFIMFMGKTYSLFKRNPDQNILSIPIDKQHTLIINGTRCFEYQYFKNTILPLIK